MGVVVVSSEHKRKKEKAGNDMGCSCVIGHVVEVPLCERGIA